MGSTSQPELARLTVRVPRGQDGFWQIMRKLDGGVRRCFTMVDVAGATNVPDEAVEHYIQRLRRGGFVELVRQRPARGANTRANVYRLAKRPIEAPRLRRDGTPVPPSAQERMWRAMRTLRQFDAKDVAFAATLPKLRVPAKTAQRYINQLALAGYLVALPRIYRLKPGMDTGPLPPSILKIEAVWDRNLKQLIPQVEHVATEAA